MNSITSVIVSLIFNFRGTLRISLTFIHYTLEFKLFFILFYYFFFTLHTRLLTLLQRGKAIRIAAAASVDELDALAVESPAGEVIAA